MYRRILWFIPILLMAASAFLGWELTDYRQGYRQAREDARKLHERYGWMASAGASILEATEDLPIKPDASQQWKQGYQQALRDYFEQARRDEQPVNRR